MMHPESISEKGRDADTMEKIVLDSAIKFGAGRYRQDRNIPVSYTHLDVYKRQRPGT